MMKAQELRIGNWYNTAEGKEPWDERLSGQDIANLEHSEKTCVTHLYRTYVPIPLTAEWLERAGFKFEGITNWRHKPTRHHVTKITEGFVYRVPGTSLVQVQYVHQLQNLYFALTNQELDFTKK